MGKREVKQGFPPKGEEGESRKARKAPSNPEGTFGTSLATTLPPHAIHGFWQTSHQSNISFMQTIIKILPENLSDRIFYCLFFEMTAGFFARCFIDMNWYGQAWLHRHTALRGMPVSTTRGRCARCMPARHTAFSDTDRRCLPPFLRGNLAAASARRAQYPRASSSRTTS